jgi:hypothetical protein
MEGEDWFSIAGETTLSWQRIRGAVDSEQERLAASVADLAAGRSKPSLTDAERRHLVLGITCHAVYHAGQVQLMKKLRDSGN